MLLHFNRVSVSTRLRRKNGNELWILLEILAGLSKSEQGCQMQILWCATLYAQTSSVHLVSVFMVSCIPIHAGNRTVRVSDLRGTHDCFSESCTTRLSALTKRRQDNAIKGRTEKCGHIRRGRGHAYIHLYRYKPCLMATINH